MTPILIEAFERTKILKQKSTVFVANTAKSLGNKVDNVTPSKTTIYRERINPKSKIMTQPETEFEKHDMLIKKSMIYKLTMQRF